MRVEGVTLLIGGVRSGKSTLAVQIGEAHDGPVTFVATAEPFDHDMAERIHAHRRDRPPWPTIDAPVDLGAALRGAAGFAGEADPVAGAGVASAGDPVAAGGVAADPVAAEPLVIVDCLTVWMANLFHHVDAAADRERMVDGFIDALAARRAPTVVITNEVGMGVHPDTELGRAYRDDLGRLNQRVAAVSTRCLLVVAGRALVLADARSLLG